MRHAHCPHSKPRPGHAYHQAKASISPARRALGHELSVKHACMRHMSATAQQGTVQATPYRRHRALDAAQCRTTLCCILPPARSGSQYGAHAARHRDANTTMCNRVCQDLDTVHREDVKVKQAVISSQHSRCTASAVSDNHAGAGMHKHTYRPPMHALTRTHLVPSPQAQRAMRCEQWTACWVLVRTRKCAKGMRAPPVRFHWLIPVEPTNHTRKRQKNVKRAAQRHGHRRRSSAPCSASP